jgi:hypothetical protein
MYLGSSFLLPTLVTENSGKFFVDRRTLSPNLKLIKFFLLLSACCFCFSCARLIESCAKRSIALRSTRNWGSLSTFPSSRVS